MTYWGSSSPRKDPTQKAIDFCNSVIHLEQTNRFKAVLSREKHSSSYTFQMISRLERYLVKFKGTQD
jgi:hypothetical protein